MLGIYKLFSFVATKLVVILGAVSRRWRALSTTFGRNAAGNDYLLR